MRVSDDLRLGHGLDDLALDEDLALAVAGGDAQVGLAGLARTVDDAAHDGDAQRDRHALEAGGDLLGQRVDVDLGAAAGRAGDDLQAALAAGPATPGSALPTLTSSTGGADSETRMVSPMPSASSAPNATADLMVPWNAGPASVTPEVQRVVALLGQQPVGADHDDRVVVLDRDLDVAEAVLLEQRRTPTAPTRPAPRAVALPYFSSSRLSSEPALTPMRIGIRGRRGGLRDLA